MDSDIPSDAQRRGPAETNARNLTGGEYVHPARKAEMTQEKQQGTALHSRLKELSSQINAMASRRTVSETDQLEKTNPSHHNADFAPAIKTLIERIEQNERASSETMDTLNWKISDLTARFTENRSEFVPEPVAAPNFEIAITNVMDHIEQAEERNREVIKSLRDRVAEIGAQVTSSPGGPAKDNAEAISQLEQCLGELASKLEAKGQAVDDNSRLATIESKLAHLADKFQAGWTPEYPREENPFASEFSAHGVSADIAILEDRVATLATQIENLTPAVAASRNSARVCDDLTKLSEQVRRIKASAASDNDLQTLRASLDNLTRQLPKQGSEQLVKLFHQQIGELAQNLRKSLPSPEEREKIAELEAKVFQLDARISEVRAKPDNAAALKALQTNVEQISDRLAEQERRIDAINQIEASVAQLTSKIQTARNEVASSAEVAVQRVAKQLKAEVDAKTDQQTAKTSEAELNALHQGLQTVRAQTQTSDKRTHDTLEVVHDTLNGIVERLSQIEAAKAAVVADQGQPAPASTSAAALASASAMQPAMAATPEVGVGNLGPAATQSLAVTEPQSDNLSESLAAISKSHRVVDGPSKSVNAPVEAGEPRKHRARQDFIAAAREAARKAGHSSTDSQKDSIGPGHNRAQSPSFDHDARSPADGKAGAKKPVKLILAGMLVLMAGALVAYVMMTRFAGTVRLDMIPKFVALAPVGDSAPDIVSDSAPDIVSDSAPDIVSDSAPDIVSVKIRSAETAPAEAVAHKAQLPVTTPDKKADQEARSAEAVAPDFVALRKNSPLPSMAVDAVATGSIERLAIADDLNNALTLPKDTPKDKPVKTVALPKDTPKDTPVKTVALPKDTPQDTPLKTVALPSALGHEGMLNAAVNGDKTAQYMVAVRYRDGNFVPKNYDEAAKWFYKAALAGLGPAQYNLAMLYERGRGVLRNIATAKVWYEHAAHKGHIKAMHNLAVLNTNAYDGSPPRLAVSAHWFAKAADLGLRDSQYNLAILYERGLGVKKDLSKAYRWYSLAADQHDEHGAISAEKLEELLSAQELAEAREFVSNWRPARAKFSANIVTAPVDGWQGVRTAASYPRALGGKSVSLLPSGGIKQAQVLLNALGLNAGAPDGLMGPATSAAVMEFERRNGQRPTGKVTSSLLRLLGEMPG